MPKYQPYIFVLWGDQFDEMAATIFVTEMRRAGLRVKVVGLNYRKLGGAHGLALVPDLTLEQALRLANSTVCLILPCTSRNISQLKNDPRLREFFTQANSNKAKFVVGQLAEADMVDLGLPTLPDQMAVYPASEELVEFARELAGSFNSK